MASTSSSSVQVNSIANPPNPPGRGGGGEESDIKMTGVLVRNFRKTPQKVPVSR